MEPITKIFDDEKVTIRNLSSEDLKHPEKFQELINSLVKENAKILIDREQTIQDEIEWLKSELEKISKKQMVHLVAQYNAEIIAGANLTLGKFRESHWAQFGIAIKNGCRGIGLGTFLMETILNLAKTDLEPAPQIIKLGVFSNNGPAHNLYLKMGFHEVARLPKHIQYGGTFIDEIIMIKEI